MSIMTVQMNINRWSKNVCSSSEMLWIFPHQ